MLSYSVCIDALFEGKDLYESLGFLDQKGFKRFEFWSWADKDIAKLAAFITHRGMTISTFCVPNIGLNDPARRGKFRQALETTIAAAKQLGVSKLITLTGDELPGVPRVKQRQSIIEGLKSCVPLLTASDMMVLVEPLNIRVDHQGYYLSRSDEAFAIVRDVGDRHVKVLFDIYHQQITEGNILASITANLQAIGHFHAAAVPGRHELYLGELDYPFIFRKIAEAGYDGDIGLEYFPTDNVELGLSRLPPLP